MNGVGLVTAIVAGGLAGWLASIVTRTNERMGCLLNVVVGVVGAVIGDWIFRHQTVFERPDRDFFGTLLVAFVGATAFLLVLRVLSRR